MAEESEDLLRLGQGCVEGFRGLKVPMLPLSAPRGVQFAPTSPKLEEGEYCQLLRLDGVLERITMTLTRMHATDARFPSGS